MTDAPSISRGSALGSIVLIDGERTALTSLHVALQRVGFVVHRFREAGASFRIIRTRAPGLVAVVTEYELRDADGIQVVKQIHAISPELPLVLVTARMGRELFFQAYGAGASRVLETPIVVPELVAALRVWCTRRRDG